MIFLIHCVHEVQENIGTPPTGRALEILTLGGLWNQIVISQRSGKVQGVTILGRDMDFKHSHNLLLGSADNKIMMMMMMIMIMIKRIILLLILLLLLLLLLLSF